MSRAEVETVLRCYPQIYFACHRRHVRDEKTHSVLSAHQAGILDHLDDVEGTSLLELARHMGVTASTMSLTVDRLERGGYARRTPRAGRRRRHPRRHDRVLAAAARMGSPSAGKRIGRGEHGVRHADAGTVELLNF